MSVRLLKSDKVAELLDVSVQRVWELTRENRIPFIRIGARQFRYSETALMNWLEQGGNNNQNSESKGEYGCLTPLN